MFHKSHLGLLLVFLYCSLHSQIVEVIDNKGTIKSIDNSKWTLTGNDIFNKNTGNVGIGLSNPSSKLQIIGDLRISGGFLDSSGDIGTSGQLLSSTGSLTDWIASDTFGWSLLGNLGTNPTTNFIGTTDIQDLVFRTNNIERLRLFNYASPIGVLGLGRNSLTGVNGGASTFSGSTLFFGDAGNISSSTGLDFIIDDDNNATNTQFTFKANGDGNTGTIELMQINENGRVGIGTTSPSVSLDVNGQARIRTLPAGLVTEDFITTDASGNLRKVAPATLTRNIYDIDGSLAGNRIVTQGTNTLNFNSTATTQNPFLITANNLTTGIGLSINSTANLTGAGRLFSIVGNSVQIGTVAEIQASELTGGTALAIRSTTTNGNILSGSLLDVSYAKPRFNGKLISVTLPNLTSGSGSGIDITTGSLSASSKALSITTGALGTSSSALTISSSNALTNTEGVIKVANTAASGTGTFATFNANSTAGSGLYILNDGNIGIGITAPTAQLHTTGTVLFGGLAGVGTRVVTTDATGNLSTATLTNGTVTSVSGTAPISVANGTTTPVISLDDLGVTTIKLADNSVTTAKISDANVTLTKIAQEGATSGQVIKWNGTAWSPAADTDTNYVGSTSVSLNGNSFEREALTGDVSAAANSNATTIANDAVTSAKILDTTIDNADLNNGVGGIFKGSGTTPASAVVVSVPTSGTLAFNPSGTQIANQFSIDGTSFSVDALNNRVGIGTITPSQTLEVVGSIFANAEGSAIVNDFGANSRLGFVKRSGRLPVIASGSSSPILLGTWSTANLLGFVASGDFTERMRIASNGNLGIGIQINTGTSGSNPTQILSLGGQAARTINVERNPIANTAGNNLTILAGGATNSATDKNGGNLLLSSGFATGTGSSNIDFQTSTAGLAGSTNNSPSTKMTILGNGNVGIGTTSPTARLHIQGDLNVTAGIIDSNGDIGALGDVLSSTSTGTDWVSISAATSTEWSRLGNNSTNPSLNFIGNTDAVDLRIRTNNLERISITADGNVGIGTISPNAPLQFTNMLANRKIVLSETVNNDHQIYGFGMNSNTLRYQVDATTANHIFYAGTSATTSSELMRIQGNGNVGIGTATPSQKLEISLGNLFLNSENSAIVSDFGANSRLGLVKKSGSIPVIAAGSGTPILLGTWSTTDLLGNIGSGIFTERMRIDSSNGNIGIGNITPTSKLDINSDTIRLRTPKTPTSSTDTCNTGDIAWDTNFVYVCVATNSWKRTALVGGW